MLSVCGNRIMIKPDPVEVEHHFDGGKLYLAKNERQERQASHTGVVVEIGHGAWWDFPENLREWCKVGDHVVFARHAGKIVTDPDDGVAYFVINDIDIQCVIKEKEKDGTE